SPFSLDDETLVYAIVRDITDRKEAEREILRSRLFLNTLLDSQEQVIVTTDGTIIHTCNEAFKKFYGITALEEFTARYDCICDTFDTEAPDGFLQKQMGEYSWIEYVLAFPEKTHKAQITWDEKTFIFSVSAAELPLDEYLLSAVFTDITLLEQQREALAELHEKVSDSIEYASLIQHALIPNNGIFERHFSDYMAIWKPRDIVGGDIYLAESISEDEILVMVIDCTGHGVPGAFVTMLVKAVERQIIANAASKDERISPAKMLQVFNRSIKHLLQQESDDSVSNAGFDAGILYYNKKERIVRFAGAEIAMYMFHRSVLTTVKGDRHSIGYKQSDVDYEFTDHELEALEGTQLYVTTDGYIDQNGGLKGFPFGKKRFKGVLEESQSLTMEEQKHNMLEILREYQGDYETNDDITVVGVKL
ncbi:MAG: SpoIIE family protein phosphatase, partial [Sulfurimonadaceae bacterium]|nr:SpoIIE family protein phosphatase [Sulfurimonadaceae bacterium]